MTEASQRVAAAEHARLAAAADAVREERARMTRELHDVLAHALTVLVVQSVAAQEDLAHGDVGEHLATRLRASEELARESLREPRAPGDPRYNVGRRLVDERAQRGALDGGAALPQRHVGGPGDPW